MKGYKVFKPNWTCKGFQFEVGKIFEEDVKPECYKHGFHFCTKAIDCFKYYEFDSSNKVAEVEALGEINTSKEDSKCCTNKIRIVREISWHEVLDLVNTGIGNTGYSNSGNNNAGDYNAGDYNTGDYNTGDYNTGDCNTGDYNTGGSNSGNRTSGYGNTGNHNSGNYNTGNYNTGHCNSGDCNSGDWNKACFSNGCFNNKSTKIFLFNKLSDWNYKDWLKSDAKRILDDCPSYLQSDTVQQEWWDALPKFSKEIVMNLPNFDKVIFKEITGIEV